MCLEWFKRSKQKRTSSENYEKLKTSPPPEVTTKFHQGYPGLLEEAQERSKLSENLPKVLDYLNIANYHTCRVRLTCKKASSVTNITWCAP